MIRGGGLLNRTYGRHKKLYTLVFLYFYEQYLVLFTTVSRNTSIVERLSDLPLLGSLSRSPAGVLIIAVHTGGCKRNSNTTNKLAGGGGSSTHDKRKLECYIHTCSSARVLSKETVRGRRNAFFLGARWTRLSRKKKIYHAERVRERSGMNYSTRGGATVSEKLR